VANFTGTGNALANSLVGGVGNDTLNGGVGTDVPTGGIGADRFVFDTAEALINADTITDFVSGTDNIALSATVFTGLNALASRIGLSARLTYDSATGALAYDGDGLGVNPRYHLCHAW
jgi:Ca2+-binding RTX toxin-like protein